jgi:1-deoxy-D-xylulose-5-phosphate reductoisomerase
VDTEHKAIHQCLRGSTGSDLKRLILTASGGPFRGRTTAELAEVSAAQALQHPTWRMGKKITIDSATLMNKGLEVIEAHWLFGVGPSQIDVVIHPQSVVHSLVEFVDGSMIAQLGVTDMRLPIQYAFSYPARWTAPLPSLNLAGAGRLDFDVPDTEAFPCLRLAYQALEAGGSLPVVLNAANEVAVAMFLERRLAFTAIADVIEQAMRAHRPAEVATLAEVQAVDRWARACARDLARGVELKD